MCLNLWTLLTDFEISFYAKLEIQTLAGRPIWARLTGAFKVPWQVHPNRVFKDGLKRGWCSSVQWLSSGLEHCWTPPGLTDEGKWVWEWTCEQWVIVSYMEHWIGKESGLTTDFSWLAIDLPNLVMYLIFDILSPEFPWLTIDFAWLAIDLPDLVMP